MLNILFLDTETTGLTDGRLIQLAYKNRNESDMFVEFYKPPVPIEFGAMGTHHITEAMVADKLPFSDSPTSKTLPELLQNSVLVAHNAPFDIGILKNEGVETGKYIDTVKVARHLYDLPDYKLQSLRYRFGVSVDASAHDAGDDVLVLEAVFNAMLKYYAVTNHVTEDVALEKFIEVTKTPMLLKKPGFGKYGDMTFEEIKAKDFGYLEWMGRLTDKDEDFIYTVQHHLNEPKKQDDAPPF